MIGFDLFVVDLILVSFDGVVVCWYDLLLVLCFDCIGFAWVIILFVVYCCLLFYCEFRLAGCIMVSWVCWLGDLG